MEYEYALKLLVIKSYSCDGHLWNVHNLLLRHVHWNLHSLLDMLMMMTLATKVASRFHREHTKGQ